MNQLLEKPKVAPRTTQRNNTISPTLPRDVKPLLRVLGTLALKLSEGDIPDRRWLTDELARLDIRRADNDDLLTLAEACSRLRLSKWSVYKLMHNGELRTVKVGSRRFVPLREVERFLKTLIADGSAL
ncbi:helix-turn-helix domain-containing protein [Nocardia sp. NPDC004068]|uniref:helix-turn-helix domain-containing protein n=1 Tax=Nocardia sp. NPDC004068 TaxID=3364303 RepID=UPI0036CDA4B6